MTWQRVGTSRGQGSTDYEQGHSTVEGPDGAYLYGDIEEERNIVPMPFGNES